MPKTRKCPVLMRVAALFVSIGAYAADPPPPPPPPLPTEAQRALDELASTEAKAQADQARAVAEARKKATKDLQAAIERETKAGDLDLALAIRDRLEEVRSGQAVPSHQPTTPATRPEPATPSSRPAAGRKIDLIPLVDPGRNTINGTWRREGATLVGTAGSNLQIPYEPPAEYDVAFDFLTDSTLISVICAKGDTLFQVGMKGWSHRYCGVRWVDGLDMFDNVTKTLFPLDSDKRYASLIQIRNTGIRLDIDGKLVFDFKTDYKNVSDKSGLKFAPKQLGLFCNKHILTVYRLEVTEVTGKGRVIGKEGDK